MLWRFIARPLLFSLPAETVHHVAMSLFHHSMFPPISSLVARLCQTRSPRLSTEICGIKFDNPVGLAAGFDKRAQWFNSLACLGFSHVEVGTITGVAQSGNPTPRLFRLPADEALINRMGFNNPGAEAVAQALSGKSIRTVLGINIGKSKVAKLEQASDDYLKSFRCLYPYARYFTVNVSSPNTPGLRQLQDREPLLELLQRLSQENRQLAENADGHAKPIFLKIAPDLSDGQLDDIVTIVFETGINGIIATNTTVSRERLVSSASRVAEIGAGGLSGKPLTQRSREVVSRLFRATERRVPIIGAGGIMTPADAWNMIGAGASMIQVYTGFIYGGPLFVQSINRFLDRKLVQHGLTNVQQAVGSLLD